MLAPLDGPGWSVGPPDLRGRSLRTTAPAGRLECRQVCKPRLLYSSWFMHSSRIRRDGMESTPKACTKRRADDALGHGRGRPYRGSTLAAKDSPAASLWDSGGLLLLLQSSRRVPRPAHEPCRSKPMGSYNTRLTACGRRVSSIVNVSCRCGGRRTLPLHPPAPPKSECRRRSIANRLAADLHRPVDPRAIYAA